MLMLRGRRDRQCCISSQSYSREAWRRLAYSPLIAALFVTASCNQGAILCPAHLPPPILVEVRDATTGQPAAQGASGWITSGSYTSPLMPAAADEPLVLASEGGAGTYDVAVQKAGYSTWTRNGVLVRGGRCGVQRSVVLGAALQPST